MKKYLFLILLFLLSFIIVFSSYYNNEQFDNQFENKLSLLAIFKNETMGLKLWIDHYIKQGVEKFYLIDNDSDDNPLEILQPYIDQGIVKYFFLPEKSQQLNHYRNIYNSENLVDKTKWLIICDIDEFYYGVPNKLSTTIDEFDDYNIVYSHHRNFGTDGLEKHPENILKSIVYRDQELNYLPKYIFKPKTLKNANNIDIHVLHDMDKTIIENDKIRLNHYSIQSLEYFQKVKMTRGDAYYEHNVRNMDYFNRANENKTWEDRVLADMQE